MCQGCGNAEEVSKPRFKRCSACRSVAYCSVDCAAEHWREEHQPVCAELRRARDRAKAALPAGQKLPSSTATVSNFVEKHPEQYVALQVLAYLLQHDPHPPWGGGAGAVQLHVDDVRRLSTPGASLIVLIRPLSELRRALRVSGSPIVEDLVSMLGRVDVDVGFVACIADEDPAVETMSTPRLRYSLAAEHLRAYAELAQRRGLVNLRCGVTPVVAEFKTFEFIQALKDERRT